MYEYQGQSNEELIKTLWDNKVFKDARVREAMLRIPRANFVPKEHQHEAFADMPLRIKEYGFNISAPHMYVVCLEQLGLQKGHKFLDVGSGCGHLTAIGAFLVGKEGVSVGVDIYDEIIKLSRESSATFCKRSGVDLRNLSFEKRNCFVPDVKERLWDRIHVGACLPEAWKHKLYEILAPGGILVAPKGDHLYKVTKDPSGFTAEEPSLSVRYSTLVLPSEEEISDAIAKLAQKKALEVKLPQPSLSFDFAKLFNSSFLADLAFVVEGKKIPAHRAVLAARSEHFAAMFKSGMRESKDKEIHLGDVSFKLFFEVLRFLYTDECQFSPENATQLLDAANYYKLDRLKAMAEHYLSKHLSIENVASLLDLALKLQANQLKKVALAFAVSSFAEVSKSKAYAKLETEVIDLLLKEVKTRDLEEADAVMMETA